MQRAKLRSRLRSASPVTHEVVVVLPDPPEHEPAFEREAFQAVARRAASAVARAHGWVSTHANALSIAASATLVVAAAGFIWWEVETSGLEASYVSSLAPKLGYQLEKGENAAAIFPSSGPYDIRLGYTRIPEFTRRLLGAGWDVDSQARLSPLHQRAVGMGLYPAYQEKASHGITVLAHDDRPLFRESFPRDAYGRLSDAPPLVVASLLFIEDRQVLDGSRGSTLNPAISWDRLTKASVELLLDSLLDDRNVPGGSTLATQLEKFRHSPNGRTQGAGDKLRQMASATARAYLLGADTRPARERIVLDYINGVPLGAVHGLGEVIGLGDGVRAWYGVELPAITKALASQPKADDLLGRAAHAQAFKRVLALFLSQRRPAYYLQQNQQDLETLTDKYVRLMAAAGIISKRLALDAGRLDLGLLKRDAKRPVAIQASFVERKATNAVRFEMKKLLGISSLYELDRLDVQATSTYDRSTQNDVTQFLLGLKSNEGALAAGLVGERLLQPDQASKVNYSFTLVERVDDHNVVRVQADTLDSPLDINYGGKMELGSTAKLRTLITYLDLVGELHARYAPLTGNAAVLDAALASSLPDDGLTRWAISWLRDVKGSRALPSASDKSLFVMLEAAMNREMSASPYVSFRTGGGVMSFNNFDATENGQTLSVARAFQKSNNLVFVRIMKDVVDHVVATRIPGAADMLKDPDHPLRRVYLGRFVDMESASYLAKFWREMRTQTSDERMKQLKSARLLTTTRFASLLLTLRPGIDFEAFKSAMTVEPGLPPLPDDVLQRYWKTMHPSIMSLNDRAYVARVHPLQLWLAAHLGSLPDASRASWSATLRASHDARFESYSWLTRKTGTARQERHVRTMLEREAFNDHIVTYWKRQGFPFDRMAPSLASALGSSGDRPSALADLMGALQNNGVLMPTRRIEEIRFGEMTPYETIVSPCCPGAKRVTSPEVAAVVRGAVRSVVDGGTAVRLRGILKRSDGSDIPVSAKTGTGDNRLETYGAGGRVLRSEAKSRTATLVFSIGERFHGTITAYVKAEDMTPTPGSASAGRQVDDFRFTSALVAQALKAVMPSLEQAVLPIEDPWAFAIE